MALRQVVEEKRRRTKPLKWTATGNGSDVHGTDGVTSPSAAASPDPRAARHAVVERHLERYPWARLSDEHGDVAQLGFLPEAAGDEGRTWTVHAAAEHRLPGPFDADVYVALSALYNAQVARERRGEDRTVATTLGELARLMGRVRGGKTDHVIRAALLRLRRTEVRAVRTFREGDVLAEERVFSLLGDVTFRHRRDGDTARTAVVVELSRPIADSIARGHFRLLDVAAYFALPSPTARRLYRYLDARRWRGAEPMETITLPLRQLAEELPIDRVAPSHLKRTLRPAHEQLLACGFLVEARYDERPRQGKRRPEIWVVYTFGAVEAAVLPGAVGCSVLPRDRRDDPAYLRVRVGELLALLQDAHSTAFYVRCAKAFDPGALDNLVGGVRQALREGLSLALARKTFTAAAKARASATAVRL